MRAFHHDIPLMLMSYLGTLKTWLYHFIFTVWSPGTLPLRLPVVLLGAITVFAMYSLLLRIAGRGTALAASALLATDATYILTTTFDWGPVAIQHLTYVAGLLYLVTGFQRKSPLRFGVAFFCFGLGMWDKALFIWMLSGSALAVVLLFPSELRRAFTRRNVGAAALGFVIGAVPLIIYNIRNPLETFHGNAHFTASGVPIKIEIARRTLEGSGLFGYLVNEESAARPKQPATWLERCSAAIRGAAGQRRSGLLVYALFAALLTAPLWWYRRRIVLFALVTMMVAWAQMLFTQDTGGSAHHIVLLWPLPHIVIAVALVDAASRLRFASTVVLAAAVGVVCLSNLLVYNQHLYQFICDGPAYVWTDAIGPLSNQVSRWENRHLIVADWGIEYPLRMLHQGRLKTLWTADDVLSHEPNAQDRAAIAQMLSLDGALFITHAPPYEIQNGAAQRLQSLAGELGYQRHLVAAVDDSNGRRVFEVAQFGVAPRNGR